jgi:hypothetical protein
MTYSVIPEENSHTHPLHIPIGYTIPRIPSTVGAQPVRVLQSPSPDFHFTGDTRRCTPISRVRYWRLRHVASGIIHSRLDPPFDRISKTPSGEGFWCIMHVLPLWQYLISRTVPSRIILHNQKMIWDCNLIFNHLCGWSSIEVPYCVSPI